MKIVIIGVGAVGFELAATISRREHDVIVIERDADLADKVAERLDCRFVVGNGVSPAVLRSVGMSDTDLFAAVTQNDEINIIACQTAHSLGARVKVARVRDEDYYEGHRLLLDGIDKAINPDHEAAHAIREILFQTGVTEVHDFAGGKVRVIGARVEEGSHVDGRTLSDIQREFGSSVALVTTIMRGDETLIPRGGTVIKAEDRVFMAGTRRAVSQSMVHFRAASGQLTKVMIVGAGPMGRELARDLLAAGVKVKLIDESEERCRLASESLRHALVLRGEISDGELLASEGLSEMDGFVAVSADEETNILGCLLARHHGAKRTVCLVDKPEYVQMLPMLGVDSVVSPRRSTSDWIASFVRRGAVINAENVGFSGAQILQLRVGATCTAANKRLRDLKMPSNTVIGAVVKAGEVVTPSGGTVLGVGDEVVVFALPESVQAVEDFFSDGRP